MSDQEILEYIRGEMSEDEIDRFLDWIEKSPAHRERYRLIRNAWDLVVLSHQEADPISNDRAYELLRSRIEIAEGPGERSRVMNIKGILRIAATVLLSVTASWLFFEYRSGPNGFHHIQVSVGQRVKLVLADSTTIWLASGSKFTYPDRFDQPKRHVELDGEAQFHVKENKEQPFEVKTATHTVNVLGTEFNVYAYDAASHFETTLYTGSVRIHNNETLQEEFQLEPGQKLVYTKEGTKTYLQSGIDSTEMDDRIEGYLIFNKTPFSDMAERLSHYYQKPIRIRDLEIAAYECTGKFHYTEKLEKILEVVRAGRSFGYRITENEVEIFSEE